MRDKNLKSVQKRKTALLSAPQNADGISMKDNLSYLIFVPLPSSGMEVSMKNKNSKSKKVVSALKKSGKKTDPQGSYTGRPDNKNEKPIQDADDL